MGFTCALGTFVTGEGISNDKNYKAIEKMLVRRLDAQGLLPEERK